MDTTLSLTHHYQFAAIDQLNFNQFNQITHNRRHLRPVARRTSTAWHRSPWVVAQVIPFAHFVIVNRPPAPPALSPSPSPIVLIARADQGPGRRPPARDNRSSPDPPAGYRSIYQPSPPSPARRRRRIIIITYHLPIRRQSITNHPTNHLSLTWAQSPIIVARPPSLSRTIRQSIVQSSQFIHHHSLASSFIITVHPFVNRDQSFTRPSPFTHHPSSIVTHHPSSSP